MKTCSTAMARIPKARWGLRPVQDSLKPLLLRFTPNVRPMNFPKTPCAVSSPPNREKTRGKPDSDVMSKYYTTLKRNNQDNS